PSYYILFGVFFAQSSRFLRDFSNLRDSHFVLLIARTFSEDLKWRIVYLYYDGHSRRKISELLHISRSIVNKVLQIYVKWGTVVNPWQKPPGRHKTLSHDEMKVLLINKRKYEQIEI
ncbi:14736_t:CDS:1, partial [Rhizophagus irregularis]